MNLLDALKKGVLNLPTEYGSTTTFTDFVNNTLSDYINFIKKINEGTIVKKLKSEIPAIETLCNSIIESFAKLYLGFPNQSYNSFAEGMNVVAPFVLKHAHTHPLSETRVYFRARSSEKHLLVNEMFHLPFDQRERATTQRFSIPGFPCLYLGSSSYVCWEELNRPAFENFYVSRFEIEGLNSYLKLRTLDISQTPQRMMAMIEATLEVTKSVDNWDDLVIDYLVKWPLIFSATIKVRYGDRNFKPEYVIPQYLLIWARENGRIDAIKYFSVKTHLNQKIDSSSFWNVVIPVQESKNDGFCSTLFSIFKLTAPVRVADIDETQPKVKSDVENYIMKFHPDPSVLLSPLKDFPTLFTDSKFGRTDMYLCKQVAESLC